MVPPSSDAPSPILPGPVVGLAHTVLRCGLAVMAAAAATDTILAATATAPAAVVAFGCLVTALAVAAIVRVDLAARLLRPTGRTTLAAALFAVAGALDGSVQTYYAQVAPAIVFLAAVTSPPRWVLACATVTFTGYAADLALAGHADGGDAAGLIATQAGDVALNAAAGLLAVLVLRRFLHAVPGTLAQVRAGGTSLTPGLAAAARRRDARLPRADPAQLVATLTGSERDVLDRLAAGRAPKQTAHDLGVALPTVRSHIAAAKRKTGARTLWQLVGLYAEGTVAA